MNVQTIKDQLYPFTLPGIKNNNFVNQSSDLNFVTVPQLKLLLVRARLSRSFLLNQVYITL